jgi:hypothetical protein
MQAKIALAERFSIVHPRPVGTIQSGYPPGYDQRFAPDCELRLPMPVPLGIAWKAGSTTNVAHNRCNSNLKEPVKSERLQVMPGAAV